MITVSDKRERDNYQNVGQSGKCHTGSVLGRIHSGGLDVATMVLIPKGSREYRGIGLVETIWKFCTSIANGRLQSSILLHDVVQGFIQGGETGTAIMEAKLEQQIVWIVHEPLFQVFLDV